MVNVPRVSSTDSVEICGSLKLDHLGASFALVARRVRDSRRRRFGDYFE